MTLSIIVDISLEITFTLFAHNFTRCRCDDAPSRRGDFVVKQKHLIYFFPANFRQTQGDPECVSSTVRVNKHPQSSECEKRRERRKSVLYIIVETRIVKKCVSYDVRVVTMRAIARVICKCVCVSGLCELGEYE